MAIRPKRTCCLCRLGMADLYGIVRTKRPTWIHYTSFKGSSDNAVYKTPVLAVGQQKIDLKRFVAWILEAHVRWVATGIGTAGLDLQQGEYWVEEAPEQFCAASR